MGKYFNPVILFISHMNVYRQVSHQSEQITKKWLVGYSLENEEMTSDEPYSGVDYKDYFLVTIGFDKRRDKIIFLSPKSLADYTEGIILWNVNFLNCSITFLAYNVS